MMIEGPEEVRGVAEPQSSSLEHLLEIPAVQTSVKDIAEWAVDPNNMMARLVEAVVNTGEPEGVLKEMDPEEVLEKLGLGEEEEKSHKRAIVVMAKAYEEKVREIQFKLREASKETAVDSELVYAWGEVISHELSTPAALVSSNLQNLASGGSPELISMALQQAYPTSLRTHLVLKNFQALHQFGVFEKGLEKAMVATEAKPISEPVFNQAISEVLAYSKKMMGNNLGDETEISGAGEPAAQVADLSEKESKESFKHLLFNLVINTLIHGERNTPVVIRKTDDGAIEIENQLKTRSPIAGVDREEYLKQLESLVTQQGLVFNGRDLREYSKMPWQGLGIALTVARILAAQLGLSIDHQVDVKDNKMRVRIKKGRFYG